LAVDEVQVEFNPPKESVEYCQLVSPEVWQEACAIISTFRADLDVEKTLQMRSVLLDGGYNLVGLRINGELLSVAGFVVTPDVVSGAEVWIRDFVTLPEHRSRGLGSLLLKQIEEFASDEHCVRVCVDTRISNEDAQRFYSERGAYEGYGVVFHKATSD
jgi:GNAT superfamily N-acetyltransferase